MLERKKYKTVLSHLVFAILGLLHFHINFSISLSISANKQIKPIKNKQLGLGKNFIEFVNQFWK